MRLKALGLCFSIITLAGCQTASEHAAQVDQSQKSANNLTVASVQREISTGMSSAAVIGVLGSPNIISTDEKRREVWVYDKISSSKVYSESKSGLNLLIIGGGSVSGATSTTQKTLTIIINFDEGGLVRDFAYHTSQF